jgi:CelD/BcsL family acetyltransferase involved in cellulose biosynthesis
VTCETIDSERSFASLAGSWDSLVRAMPRPSPFMLHGWLQEWWHHFGVGRELAVHIARRDGELVGALPLFIRPRFGVRVASFVGEGESALADVLLAEGAGSSVTRRLVEHIATSRVDAVDVFGLPLESGLAAALGPSRIQLVERVEAPVLDLGHDWETFYATKVHASRRRTHRRRSRSLASEGKLAVELARTGDAVAAALDDVVRLHQLRWGSQPDRSTLGTEAGQRFHRDALTSLAREGVARITTMKVDGRAIAFQCWFALGSSAYLYRQSYDPAFARFGLGFAITLEVAQVAMAEGLTRLELLGGAESHKLELADRLEPMHQGVGLAQSIRGRAFVTARVAALRVFRHLRHSDRIRHLYYDGFAPARRAVLSLRGPQA